MRRTESVGVVLSTNEKAALDAVAQSFERTRGDTVRLLVKRAALELKPTSTSDRQNAGV